VRLDAGTVVVPVVLMLPTGPTVVGHFDVPFTETIRDDGSVAAGIEPEDTPSLLAVLMHKVPDPEGAYHRPPPEGYHVTRHE
jgi:hypothetical protein